MKCVISQTLEALSKKKIKTLTFRPCIIHFGTATVIEIMHYIHKHLKYFTCSVADEQVADGRVLLPQ